VGHAAIIEQGYGLSFREPLRATREFVQVVRAVLSGERVTRHGDVFRVDAFQLESKPRHPVPIYLAALGPAMLRLAGEIADGVILNWMPLARLPWAIKRVHEGCRLAGRDPRAVKVVCYVRAGVTDDAGGGRAVLRRLVAAYAAMPSYARMFEEAGRRAAVATARAAWEGGGIDAAATAIPDEFVRELGVAGTAEECCAVLQRYRTAGADVVAAYPFPIGEDPAASMRRTIEELARAW
ncbi:MAG: LLM class flavin-dependent oxidoreductase, partial [Armatimonadota bacterium]|nr:LLM class flavin-dependent oxidoreductase [Armatimonadota bacterium]